MVFVVVKCYSCNTYMPQLHTKNNKWHCRMCGEKQSVTTVFARSEQAKDLRPVAQKLNARRNDFSHTAGGDYGADAFPEYDVQPDGEYGNHHPQPRDHPRAATSSRWAAFKTEEREAPSTLLTQALVEGEHSAQFVLELPGPHGGQGKDRTTARRKARGRCDTDTGAAPCQDSPLDDHGGQWRDQVAGGRLTKRSRTEKQEVVCYMKGGGWDDVDVGRENWSGNPYQSSDQVVCQGRSGGGEASQRRVTHPEASCADSAAGTNSRWSSFL